MINYIITTAIVIIIIIITIRLKLMNCVMAVTSPLLRPLALFDEYLITPCEQHVTACCYSVRSVWGRKKRPL